MRDEMFNKLMYVPFNDNFKVNSEIKKLLTTEEFFEKCFVEPEFDEYIEHALSAEDGEEIQDFEIDIEKSSIIQNLKEKNDELEALNTWLISGQSDLYCFLGDAGVGKTTFLHYLHYKHKKEQIKFDILDIQDAIEKVSILGNYVHIPTFNTLYSKAASTVLLNIDNLLFPTDEDGKIDKKTAINNFQSIVEMYEKTYKEFFPRQEVEDFFLIQPINVEAERAEWKNYSNRFADFFKNLFFNNTVEDSFAIILEIYIYLKTCLDSNNRHIIAFDNFERFIKSDEIFNGQLIEFVSQLRGIQNYISDNNPHLSGSYQLILCMRHTSVRMFTSQQITDFIPHTVDLNKWFDASSVLKKKIDWYDEKNISVGNMKYLSDILDDMGECGNTLRGLHFKISMLFNHNKRVIAWFLIRVLLSPENASYIEKYNHYWNEECGLTPSLAKFAARSIIYRLVLNELRADKFFEYIFVQKKEIPSTPVGTKESMGYARKILTVLYEYELDNMHNYETLYMPLTDMLKKIFPATENTLEMLFDKNNECIYNDIAQVLFYMNYYDTRQKNWLQFIDIQYNVDEHSHVEISDGTDLGDLIRKYPQEIKLRITNAGKAYLYFVVYYFEYFACKSIYTKNHAEIFKTKDVPPLMYVLPTPEEIEACTNVQNLKCVKVIKLVLLETLSCISKMNQSDNTIPFKKGSKYISHNDRIVNSHKGYLDNFIECLKLICENNDNRSNTYNSKVRELMSILYKMRDSYDPKYVERKNAND